MSPLELTYVPVGKNGNVTLTARLGDDVLCCEKLDILKPKLRDAIADKLCSGRDGIDRAHLDARLLRIASESSEKKTPDTEKKSSRDSLLADIDTKSEEALTSMPSDVVREAEALLADPRLIDRIVSDIANIGVVGEKELALSIYLVGTSRLLRKPLSGIVHGLSSSGKSFTIDAVAGLFPQEAMFKATDITAQALYYLDPGSLIHKFVVAGERSRKQDDDRAEATRALREMLASGELRKAVPFSDGKRLRTSQIVQPGPIAYVETTTLTTVFDEDANRCLALSSDESVEQTERVVNAIANQAMYSCCDAAGAILRRHHALQLLLRRVNVVIPFADKLAQAMPKQRPQARRAIGHVLDMIRAVALLHQRQRAVGELRHGDKIQAEIDDYVVARRLLVGPLGRSLGGQVTPAVANFGKRMTGLYGDGVFTPAQAAKDDSILSSKGKVNEYLRALADVGSAECVEEHKGNKPSQWRMVGEAVVSGAEWLPKVNQSGEFE